ncbi:YggT family protein [Sediminihabitans luteus]|uniref:YggT family protein n=1 Tax=Sediminihabitans luteus TaxID=1138585 RepID=A0A2M9CCL7_9CELL|nr:YggT family protein [Sediminihabitans luteus]PJJ69089.1 YggT family protein [Sediminihabitans luteus]GII99475.1 hypothetical protein Slu03_18530 [Sediminihabitans luteus]
MTLFFQLVGVLLWAYWIVLLGRLVLDLVQQFARQWRPTGVMLVLAELLYTVTDPPLRAIRKIVPPLRIGGVAIDLAFLILFIVVSFGSNIALNIAR